MSTLQFNQALTELEDNLKSFALNFTNNLEDAKDLTQETMLRAITYQKYYKPRTNFKAWVFTIMRNTFINQYRRKSISKIIFDNSKDSLLITNKPGYSESPISQIYRKDIELEVNKLKKELKDPFKMHCKGYKYKEIAEQFDIPIGTVKSRIFLARKKLIDSLPDHDLSKN